MAWYKVASVWCRLPTIWKFIFILLGIVFVPLILSMIDAYLQNPINDEHDLYEENPKLVATLDKIAMNEIMSPTNSEMNKSTIFNKKTIFQVHAGKNEMPNSSKDKLREVKKVDSPKNHEEALLTKELEIVNDQDFLRNETVLNAILKLKHQQFQKPTKIKTFNEKWQILNGDSENYIMSAYYDDRPTLDKQYIRIIGILQVPEVPFVCILWFRASTDPIISPTIKHKIGVRYPRHWKYFDPSLVSCPVPANNCIPEYVSLELLDNPTPSTLMKIQIPEKPTTPINFGICVSASYWRIDPYRLVEWIELQKIFGAGEITMYDNGLSQETLDVLHHYRQEGYVDLRRSPNAMWDEGEMTMMMNMSPVINDCMYRNLYRYKKIVCIDVDEYIVPRKHWTYKGMLDAFDAIEPRDHPYKSYMFRNMYFFLDLKPIHVEPWFLVTPRYLSHVNPSTFGYAVKCITDPMVCVGLQNHVCWHPVEKYKTPAWLREVPPVLGLNQHYKKCHLDNNEMKGECHKLMLNVTQDHTMMRFEKILEHHASLVLSKLGLLKRAAKR